eukprot:CAMPEP_0194484378 /NCGR_PEP_ID=MMETSP0253-20130528/5708_1 /TAXON_ID=2966 /ORGANISM="Noctiluca scintillans" /LENGTH=148 /DNA_ID=CAMNT_0039324171 /DNA_START=286 /DNA_END=732 /DNA_ORIENTATION=+
MQLHAEDDDHGVNQHKNWEEDAHYPQRPPHFVADSHYNALRALDVFLECGGGESMIDGIAQLADEEDANRVHDESLLVLAAGNKITSNPAEQSGDHDLGYGQRDEREDLVPPRHTVECPRLVSRTLLSEHANHHAFGASFLLVKDCTS